MGGKGEMGLRLFPINDNTITSRSTTNMLKEFAFFLHFMCENSSNLSSSDDIQGGKSLLGSADLKSRPVYKKYGHPRSHAQTEIGAGSGNGFLDFSLFTWRWELPPEVPPVTVTVLRNPLEGKLRNQHCEEPRVCLKYHPDQWLSHSLLDKHSPGVVTVSWAHPTSFALIWKLTVFAQSYFSILCFLHGKAQPVLPGTWRFPEQSGPFPSSFPARLRSRFPSTPTLIKLTAVTVCCISMLRLFVWCPIFIFLYRRQWQVSLILASFVR